MRLALIVPLFAVACATPPVAEAPESPPPPAPVETCSSLESFANGAGSDPVEAARRWADKCGLAATSSLTDTLVRFPTVRAREGKTGPAFVAMRAYLERWSRQNGFDFESFDDDPWVISWGTGAPSVAFVMHADVVPVVDDIAVERPRIPPGWTKPPFEVTTEGSRLYGRGTEDDKGAIAVVLNTMRALKTLGHEPNGRVLAILGTGEEHDWDGMAAYSKSQPSAKFVVSIDAEFPVVVAESGFVAWRLQMPVVSKAKKRRGCVNAIGAKAGQFLTQVPGEASVIFDRAPENLDRVATEIAKRKNIRYEIIKRKTTTTLEMHGRAVHSSVADEGDNALWALAAVTNQLDLCPSGIRDALTTVAKYFDEDHWGVKLGLAYEHPTMGRLLVIPTVLRVEDGRVTLSINMRRPAGREVDAFNTMLDGALAKIKKEVSSAIVEKDEGRYVGKPALCDTSGPLVETLLDIYKDATGDTKAAPISIRGGTYARLFDGAVSFGPAIPGNEYRGHAPDEFVESAALQLMNKTVLEALVRLDGMATESQSAGR